ncbi:MAG TPA: DUF3015 domain-containing protein [Gammaproteobacteria bacterium]|nr:DUF3015 domain-containing protein [Gammaproteobacteria bacterium]
MKKLIVGSVLLVSSSAALAVAPGGPDCGWGNMLFEGQSGLGPHFVATTTNGTSGNKTFGMTSGTNGCSTDGALTYGGTSLVSNMMDEFSEDVARGHGDALNAVAASMGVEKADRELFAKVAHDNFNVIFPSENVTAREVTAALNALMKADSRLAKYAV